MYIIYLYKLECWDLEPSKRPNISQVVERLKEIISKTNPSPKPINDNDNDIMEDQSSQKQTSVSSSLRNFNFLENICGIGSEELQNEVNADTRHDANLAVQINDCSHQLTRLNLRDSLSNIR